MMNTSRKERLERLERIRDMYHILNRMDDYEKYAKIADELKTEIKKEKQDGRVYEETDRT